MKRFFLLKGLGMVLAGALSLSACTDSAPEGDKATITDKQETANAGNTSGGVTYVIDTSASRIRFTGHGVGKNHPGRFRLSSGSVTAANNQITGGQFVININSMEMEEQGKMITGKLRPHLLSGDFFDASKFGTARFEITAVTPYQPNSNDTSLVEGANFNVSGNFTLKDVTKNITFPAKIDLDDNTMKARANFDIDRRQWQMNYGNDKTLGDQFISETVNIELDLQAKRQ